MNELLWYADLVLILIIPNSEVVDYYVSTIFLNNLLI